MRYADFLRETWRQTRVVAPIDIKHAVSKYAPQFGGWAQHDAQEFLAFLLDGLHEDLNRVEHKVPTEAVEADGRDDCVVAGLSWENHLKRNRSIIVDNFQGMYKSRVVCPHCDRVSVTFDPCMYATPARTVQREQSNASTLARRRYLQVPVARSQTTNVRLLSDMGFLLTKLLTADRALARATAACVQVVFVPYGVSTQSEAGATGLPPPILHHVIPTPESSLLLGKLLRYHDRILCVCMCV